MTPPPSRIAIFLTPLLALVVVGAAWKFIGIASEQAPKKNADIPESTKSARIDSALAFSVGPNNAKVTIVEFLDFECPYCKQFAKTMKELMDHYSGQSVRFVFRHLPLVSIHPQALPAANASLCANEQGSFLAMHDLLFAQKTLQSTTTSLLAQQLILYMEKFNTCLLQERYKSIISKDISDALDLKIKGTPTFFVNGERLEGAVPFPTISSIIDSALHKEKKKKRD